jgi:regulator of protease activity HflC (stomatin/prohibitin superfamily)
MAEIGKYLILNHLRSEPISHILYYRKGKLVKSGPGIAFWFDPFSAAIAEIPIDDRDQSFLFNGWTADYQQVAAQGSITFRITDPELLAKRVDFSIDLNLGLYKREPLEKLASLVSQLAQQYALEYIESMPLRTVLREGIEEIRNRINVGLSGSEELSNLGIEIVTTRISRVSPSSEMEKALQAPARESIQQEADQAIFERRALAVEKERAIAENELQNQIELAKREETLIEQKGINEKRRAMEEAEARKISAIAEAKRIKLESAAKADSITMIEAAQNKAEKEKMEIFKDMPISVLYALAAQALASNLPAIEHLNLSPDALGPILTNFLTASTRKIESEV